MLKSLSRLVFPPKCYLCSDYVFDDDSLCSICWSKISFIKAPFCDKCGRGLSAREQCKCDSKIYSKVRSAAVYDENSSGLVHRLKYCDDTKAKKLIAKPL